VAKLEDDKAELLKRAEAVAHASRGTGGPPHGQVGELLAA
jgi:glutamate dehydrogenase